MRKVTSIVASLALLAAYAAAQGKPVMVYVTEQGKSYHVKNCRLKHGSKGMALAEAKKKGYKPCKICKPPQ